MNTAKKFINEQPYSYELSQERIAQRPLYPYDEAKLLIANCQEELLKESSFKRIAEYLKPEDLLIFNNSQVIPARLFGKIAVSGGSVEVLLVEERNASATALNVCTWLCMARPLKKFKTGVVLEFGSALYARVLERLSEQMVLLEFFTEAEDLSVELLLQKQGLMPVPPYIRKGHSDAQDRKDYQSIFAKDRKEGERGSVAAPTASLHFTKELVKQIKAQGTSLSFVTLHVGTASFLALWDGEGSELRAPGSEYYLFSKQVLEDVKATRARGGRVIAVGTTVVRALESMALREAESAKLNDTLQSTELFIRPGYKFLTLDGLITNFHQPGTTHLLLVEALLGRSLLDKAYKHALTHDFRFLSYGDGMLIIS